MEKHWIWLTTRKGIGPVGRAALIRLFGSAERVYALTEEMCRSTEGFEARWLEGVLDKDLSAAEQILVDCDNKDIHIVCYHMDEYPDRLRNLPDAPPVLYYRGSLPNFDDEAAIAVVGTRKCSAYGLLHAKQFSRLIAASGGMIISGGARGIDTMALRGALDSMMPVACVLGCGVDVVYPPENRFLFRDIVAHGCLLSEYPPGTRPDRGNFPARNRIISGLSVGVLVIEAPEQSGALITAQHALEQGRDVFAIPGNIGVKNNEGTNRLLREGAQMVTDGWELLSNYTYLFPGKLADARRKESLERIYRTRYGSALPVYSPVAEPPEPPEEKKVVDNPPRKTYSDGKEPVLTDDERRLLEVLGTEPEPADEVIARAGLPTQRVLAAMTMLQIKRLAVRENGNLRKL